MRHTSSPPVSAPASAARSVAGAELWRAQVPPAVARWLAGPEGPLSAGGGAGVIEHLGDGVVRLDRCALQALSGQDGEGRVEWADLIPVLRTGASAWPLVRE